MSHAREFRWAVGGADIRRSAVWKLKTHKDSVYVLSRMMGADAKMSFHGSADGSTLCQWSMTSEWVQREAKEGAVRNQDRHIVKWALPPTSGLSALHLLRIIVPNSELRTLEKAESLRRVVWIPAPPKGSALSIECYLTPPTTSPSNTAADAGYTHLVSLPGSDGRWFVCFRHAEPVTAENADILETARAVILQRAESDGIVVSSQTRAVGHAVNAEGFRSLIEIAPLRG